jgi:hypothetical protein
MKKFILFLLMTTAALILLDRAFGFLFDRLYSGIKTGQTGGKINYYLSLPVTPKLVIMGNSRAFYQVIPDSFKIPSFNLSHAGMHQIFQTGLLSIMEGENKMPSLILLHLEPEEFTGEQRNRDIQNLKYYYGKNNLVTKYLAGLSGFERFKFYFELYRYNGRAIASLKNYFQTLHSDASYNGYEAIKSSERDSLNTLYSLRNEIKRPELKFNYDQLKFLQEFIDIGRRNNARIICFTSPHFKNSNRQAKASSILDSLLTENHVEYINYSLNPIADLDAHPVLWKDSFHLNHDGAQIESQFLSKSVLEILKAGSRRTR